MDQWKIQETSIVPYFVCNAWSKILLTKKHQEDSQNAGKILRQKHKYAFRGQSMTVLYTELCLYHEKTGIK